MHKPDPIKIQLMDVLFYFCLDDTDVAQLQRLQNSCLRFISGNRQRQGLSQSLKPSERLDIFERKLLHSTSFFYNILPSKTLLHLYNNL